MHWMLNERFLRKIFRQASEGKTFLVVAGPAGDVTYEITPALRRAHREALAHTQLVSSRRKERNIPGYDVVLIGDGAESGDGEPAWAAYNHKRLALSHACVLRNHGFAASVQEVAPPGQEKLPGLRPIKELKPAY